MECERSIITMTLLLLLLLGYLVHSFDNYVDDTHTETGLRVKLDYEESTRIDPLLPLKAKIRQDCCIRVEGQQHDYNQTQISGAGRIELRRGSPSLLPHPTFPFLLSQIFRKGEIKKKIVGEACGFSMGFPMVGRA